jgi:hypothetical protein
MLHPELQLSMAETVASLDDASAPDAASVSALAAARAHSLDEKWDLLINRLIDWGGRQGEVDEDGWQMPTSPAIGVTCQLLTRLRSAGVLPFRMVPSGEGGISVELIQVQFFAARLEVKSDGSAEYINFVNNKITVRQAVSTR